MTAPRVDEDSNRTYASREEHFADLEKQRRAQVRECRSYYNGVQYDEDNEACRHEWLATVNTGEKSVARMLFDQYQLPEHLRRHAYSTQIAESVDWIADRLSEAFAVEAEPARVGDIVNACLDASPELAAGDTDEDRTVATILRESAKTGDVPVLVRWDATGGACWLEFWDSEQVEMRFVDGRPDQLDSVAVQQLDWREVDGRTQQVTVRREWVLSDGDEGTDSGGQTGRRCVERVWITGVGGRFDERPVETVEWGLPVLPWWLLRAQRGGLRATRGTSLITDQAMRTADRYNAVEQVSWLIARYNSHGNLAVVGDTVMVAGDEKPVHKDVADVLKFPGGTDVTTVTLPTDPAMIEHQKRTLVDALYGRFGLQRTDQETLSNLGQVSGYALEILNQRMEGTFARVRAQLVRDFKALLNLVVDCHEAWSTGDVAEPADEEQELSTIGAGTERSITVRLGSGWVVDEAAARDDYLAGAISRRELLRVKGKSDEQIDGIENEIAEETQQDQPAPGETTRFAAAGNGGSTQAGSTLNNIRTGHRPLSPDGIAP